MVHLMQACLQRCAKHPDRGTAAPHSRIWPHLRLGKAANATATATLLHSMPTVCIVVQPHLD